MLRLSKVFLFLAATGGAAACSGATDASLAIEPITIEKVDVLILESAPPQASAHIQGVIGDGCSDLHSEKQTRSGNTVTIEILRERRKDAVCTQIAKLYDTTMRLTGTFPPGRYVLRVNGVETAFTTQ